MTLRSNSRSTSCVYTCLVLSSLSVLPPSLPPSLTRSLPHSLSPSLPPSLTPSLTPSLPPSLPHSLPPSTLTPSLTEAWTEQTQLRQEDEKESEATSLTSTNERGFPTESPVSPKPLNSFFLTDRQISQSLDFQEAGLFTQEMVTGGCGQLVFNWLSS